MGVKTDFWTAGHNAGEMGQMARRGFEMGSHQQRPSLEGKGWKVVSLDSGSEAD